MYNSIELIVRKWGNSIGIRIPKQLAELMNAEEGSKLKLTFKKDHVEMRLSDEELEIAEPRPVARVRKKRMDVPNYDQKLRSRKTPITLNDSNFQDIIDKYPFVVVLFLDYMHLDFYDRIEEKVIMLRELGEAYSGNVWFGIARIEENELAREKYVGNVWGEEEVRGFINGNMTFKSGKLSDAEDAIRRIVPPERLEGVKRRETHTTPVIATTKNINGIIGKKSYVVAGFFPPGEKKGVALFNELARRFHGEVTFTYTTDRVLFNEKSRTFYRNPLFERFNIIENNEILLINRGSVVRREDTIDRDTIVDLIDIYLLKGSKK